MRYLTTLIFGLSLFMAIFSSCDNEATEPSQESGYLIVHLTDAPAIFDAVNITFSEISAHIDSDWVTIKLKSDSTVNLLDWTNGRSMILGQDEIPAGHYTQVRLIIESAEIVIQNQTFPLVVPSGAQTGLKLGFHFTVDPGSAYELVLDFDVNKSIITTGPKKSPKGYKLKPHIRVISKAVSGSISGTVTNPGDVPTAYAILGADTTTATTVDTLSGYFMLSFLPEDSYAVAIEDTTGKSVVLNDVSVVVGQDNDIGTVTLQ